MIHGWAVVVVVVTAGSLCACRCVCVWGVEVEGGKGGTEGGLNPKANADDGFNPDVQ